MLILSLNVWGLGGSPKAQSLKPLFSSAKDDLSLIQETMSFASRACNYSLEILPRWDISTMDVVE